MGAGASREASRELEFSVCAVCVVQAGAATAGLPDAAPALAAGELEDADEAVTAGPLGAGAVDSQFHWLVSASGGELSPAWVPLVPLTGGVLTFCAGDGAVSVGAGVPAIAALMLVCTPVTADL